MTSDGRSFFHYSKRADTVSFLEHIDKVYKEVGKMVLFLDKASHHTSKDATAFFEERDIILVWYPTGHPYLNPVEEVWSVLNGIIEHSVRYSDINSHLNAMFNFINTHTSLIMILTDIGNKSLPKD